MSKSHIYKIELRDRLYFNRYSHVMVLWLKGAWLLRNWRYQDIDLRLLEFPRIIHWLSDTSYLIDAVDVFKKIKGDFRTCFYLDWIYVYTSRTAILNHLESVGMFEVRDRRQAKVVYDPNILTRVNPKNKFRSYFRSQWISAETSRRLVDFFAINPQMKPSDSLIRGITSNVYPCLSSHNFVDHDDPKQLLFLQLILPNCIRKTLPVHAK